MNNFHELSLMQLMAGYRRADFSVREVTQAAIDRCQHLEPSLHTLITPNYDAALAQAELADQRYAEWRRDDPSAWWQLPPLLGLPLMVKDVISVEGIRCTCGSHILGSYTPPFHATAVRKLLDAGGLILGKTNTDEFAMGSSTETSAFGRTMNPWNLEYVPGGSSGGSAAAVAAGLVPAALGSDTGGSIRQPASFCSVTGLKPTYGRVSRYGLVAYGSSLDCIGPFARSAADAMLVYQQICGQDPLDATTAAQRQAEIILPRKADLRGLRMGVPEEYFQPGLNDAVRAAVQSAIAVYESLGVEILPIRLPHTEYAVPVYYLLAPAEASANLARYDGVRYGRREPADAMWDVFYQTRGVGFGAEVKRRIMLGTYALSAGYYDAYYGQAQRVRALIRADFTTAFEKVDLIVSPVAPGTAFIAGERGDDPLAMYLEDVYTLPANLAGIPAIAFPCGFDPQQLPIGLQLMAPHFSEERLLRAAHAYQQVTDWHLRRPDLPI